MEEEKKTLIVIYPTMNEAKLIQEKFLASGERSRSFWIIKEILKSENSTDENNNVGGELDE